MKKRFTEEQIIPILKEAEADLPAMLVARHTLGIGEFNSDLVRESAIASWYHRID